MFNKFNFNWMNRSIDKQRDKLIGWTYNALVSYIMYGTYIALVTLFEDLIEN
jgi:hypothetical protein